MLNKPQTQEARKNKPRLILFKLLKINDRTIKTEKKIMYTEAKIRMKLFTGNNEVKRQWSNTFKVLKEKLPTYNSTPS